MLFLLTLFCWFLAGLLVVLAVFLGTPVRFRVQLIVDTSFRYLVLARPFGGIFPAMRLADSQKKQKATQQRRETQSKKKTSRRQRKRLYVKDALLEFPDMVQRIVRAIHIDSLTAHGEFGLGDPADTGEMFGYLTPVIYGSSHASGLDVVLQPNFDRACLSGKVEAEISVVPAALLAPVLHFIWRLAGPFR